jgi:hypothetical protein
MAQTQCFCYILSNRTLCSYCFFSGSRLPRAQKVNERRHSPRGKEGKHFNKLVNMFLFNLGIIENNHEARSPTIQIPPRRCRLDSDTRKQGGRLRWGSERNQSQTLIKTIEHYELIEQSKIRVQHRRSRSSFHHQRRSMCPSPDSPRRSLADTA